MTPPLVKRLVLFAVLGTSASMLLMVAGVIFPSPFLLVLVMSVGQGLGLLSLALFLLAVTLDIQGAIAGPYDDLPAEGEQPPEGEASAPSGLNPSA
jgi:hypothetical protein